MGAIGLTEAAIRRIRSQELVIEIALRITDDELAQAVVDLSRTARRELLGIGLIPSYTEAEVTSYEMLLTQHLMPEIAARLNRGADASAFVREMIQGPYADDADTLTRFSSLLSGELDPGPAGRQAAVDAAQRAVEIMGDDPNALAQLGHAQFVAGDVRDAIDSMTRARDLCPPDSGMYEVIDDYIRDYERSTD